MMLTTGDGISNPKAKRFIDKAMALYGDRYDYSLVDYVHVRTKVKILCKLHGEFLQTPAVHLSGHGCSKCSGRYVPTTSEWVDRARLVHGDRYDYSDVEYKTAHKPVKIICKTHGTFLQAPGDHLKGNGCSVCSGKRKPTTSEWISKAKSVHGDRYDYSAVEYKTAFSKVKIICKTHGDFLQTPNDHLKGSGCSVCAKYRVDTAQFIEKARLVHGDLYDYSLTDYVNAHKRVDITCKEHGVFSQVPCYHLSGNGCSACGGAQVPTTSEWISKAKSVHGDRYDYSLVDYIKSASHVSIICREHGSFLQTPTNHVSNGTGCPVCAQIGRLMTSDEFIERSMKRHGDLYNYSQVQYTGSARKVELICPTHGSFQKSARLHLEGSGCPLCSDGGGYKTSKPGILYYVRFDLPEMTLWKIGITNISVRRRFAGFKVKPVILWQRRWEDGHIAAKEEHRILNCEDYAKHRYTGQPLLPSGNTECFTIDIMQLGNTTRVVRCA